MIKISKKSHLDVFLPDERAADVLLQLCGGGYRVGQTTKAMASKGVLDTEGKVTIHGVTVTKVPDLEVEV